MNSENKQSSRDIAARIAITDLSELDKLLQEESLLALASAIKRALAERRSVLVAEIARRLTMAAGIDESSAAPEIGEDLGWQAVKSLSAIRAIAGGRFSNLKEMWLGAGFPLREHRGDDAGVAVVDQNNWLKFSSWLIDRGFEVRLAGADDACFFYVRALPQTR